MISRRKALYALAGIPAAGAYAFGIEPRWLDTEMHKVRMPLLGRPVRLAHLSDLHASSFVSQRMIADAVGIAIASKPDVICLTGDYISYQDVPEAVEREHIARAIEIHTRLTGGRPLGWYTGRTSPNTRRLVAEEGGFLYDADDYSDDLPFWTMEAGKPHLIVPYTLEANDMRFSGTGLNTGEQFYSYLKDAFDVLYAEGEDRPKMMSVGLHCRLSGRPGKLAGLERFIRYAQGHKDVWFCRRIDIARHWRERHPCVG